MHDKLRAFITTELMRDPGYPLQDDEPLHEALQLMFLTIVALWYGEDHELTTPGRMDQTLDYEDEMLGFYKILREAVPGCRFLFITLHDPADLVALADPPRIALPVPL